MLKIKTFIFFLIMSFSEFAQADAVIDKNNPPAELDLYVEYCFEQEYCGIHLEFNEMMTPEELTKWGRAVSPIQTPAKSNQYFFYIGDGKNGRRIGVVDTEPGSGKFTTIYAPADDPARQYLLMLELGFKISPGTYFKVLRSAPEGDETLKKLPVILAGVFSGLEFSENGVTVRMNIPERPEKIACRLVADESPLIEVGALKEGDPITFRGVLESFDKNVNLSDCYFNKNQDDFDFRQVRWGMSRNDVIKSEPESPLDLHQDTLVYLTKLDDADFKLLYYFIDGQELAAASFRLDQKYTNNNNYIKLYARLCDQLTQKYGRPVSDEMEWSQTHYRDKPESLGFAYSLGHVATTKQWETPTTIITAVIGGEKLNVVVAIDYESKQHYERMETQKRKDTASMP